MISRFFRAPRSLLFLRLSAEELIAQSAAFQRTTGFFRLHISQRNKVLNIIQTQTDKLCRDPEEPEEPEERLESWKLETLDISRNTL